MPSYLNNSRGTSAALLLLALAGCASHVAELPPDTTGTNRGKTVRIEDFSAEDAALSCIDIAAERQSLSAKMQAANASIEGNRVQNEAAVYAGGFLLVPYLATESNSKEKDEIKALYARQDTLIKLAGVKNCTGT